MTDHKWKWRNDFLKGYYSIADDLVYPISGIRVEGPCDYEWGNDLIESFYYVTAEAMNFIRLSIEFEDE